MLIINMKIKAYDVLAMSAKEKNKVRKGLEIFGLIEVRWYLSKVKKEMKE